MPTIGPSMMVNMYYSCKRHLPVPLRRTMRWAHARWVLAQGQPAWPIDEAAAWVPDGWPGWPDGKRFAFVLTHDVEGQAGLDKVRRLAELEMELGFRSSFNFVPEGAYRVPAELRTWLLEHGFEVGVHDLHHDGHLYRSRQGFAAAAQRINGYLREWGAVGFRSAFMLHQLEWLHDLEVLYDASTFDTDPFEPQPDGFCTIFPFRVLPGAGQPGRAYIELPYTLVQDSTLFLNLREQSPAIWVRKLEWLAKHGGMALMNVHPDYVRFEGERRDYGTFPVDCYRSFLMHVKEHHGGSCWQPLAKDLARYADEVLPPGEARPRRHVCMITFSVYEGDNRVLRYAEALAARGDRVDVLALRRSPELPLEETINGVRVLRIQDRFDKSATSQLGHLLPLLRFMARASRWLRRHHAAAPYDLLHIHNMPDFLVFAGWYPKLKGAKVILDIHDIVPELYANKFGKQPRGVMHTLLKWMERASAAFADHVIVANHLWLEKYGERAGVRDRCSAFINNVDDSIFRPEPRRRDDGKLVVLFPGTLQWHQGVDIAIDAFRRVHAELPQAEFHIYGDGIAKASLIEQAQQAGLNGSVKFFNPLSLREIARVTAQADLGVVPKRADSFGNEAYSTKIMEFMAAGVPVVCSSTRIDRFYFDDSVVRFFESGDAAALAREMLEVLRSKESREQQVGRALDYVARNCWNTRRADYLALVDGLIATGSHPEPRPHPLATNPA